MYVPVLSKINLIIFKYLNHFSDMYVDLVRPELNFVLSLLSYREYILMFKIVQQSMRYHIKTSFPTSNNIISKYK